MKSRIYILPGLFAILCGVLISFYVKPAEPKSNAVAKINGVNFVAPPNVIGIKEMQDVKRIHANWVSIIPYSYISKNSSEVIFFKDHPHWWGEGTDGCVEQITLAKSAGLKVMVKPQVWVVQDGWPGEFDPGTEEGWLKWEASFSTYILTYARISDSLEADLFCIGTEFRIAVVQRPLFWNDLIQKVKAIYSGEITYAANWDNYQNVGFWDALDYIGIDAYFPLSDKRSPEVNELIEAWSKNKAALKQFSQELDKKILFTEYGYRSMDYATRKPWSEDMEPSVNLKLQADAYEALYSAFWNEEWVQGGFLWKWFPETAYVGGKKDADFTPQNKDAEAIISAYYKANN